MQSQGQGFQLLSLIIAFKRYRAKSRHNFLIHQVSLVTIGIHKTALCMFVYKLASQIWEIDHTCRPINEIRYAQKF